jgi:hypothetical protein
MSDHTSRPWKAQPTAVSGTLISYGDSTKGENVCVVLPQKE